MNPAMVLRAIARALAPRSTESATPESVAAGSTGGSPRGETARAAGQRAGRARLASSSAKVRGATAPTNGAGSHHQRRHGDARNDRPRQPVQARCVHAHRRSGMGEAGAGPDFIAWDSADRAPPRAASSTARAGRCRAPAAERVDRVAAAPHARSRDHRRRRAARAARPRRARRHQPSSLEIRSMASARPRTAT